MSAPEVTRFEVIDHRANVFHDEDRGRVYAVDSVCVALSYQDAGRTLKVFVTDRRDGAA